MDLELRGKVVLITGGSKGLGLACARAFLAEGAVVAIAARDPDNLALAAASLGAAAGQLSTHAVDLGDAGAAIRMVAAVEEQHGAIDVLVNSAGSAQRKSIEDLDAQGWRAAMDAKYFTYLHVIDPVVKSMMKRRSGAIVNIIGMGGKMARPTHLAGGAANAALMLVSSGLATACAGHGIRVNAINPGLTLTGRINNAIGLRARREGLSIAEATEQELRDIPMGRFGTPEEVADVAVFLASARASYVSGTQVTMDGASTPCVV